MSKCSLPLIIRSYEFDSDNRFITDSWCRQLYTAMPYSYTPAHIWFPAQLKLVNDILQSSECIVACLADDPDIIVAYLCYEFIEKTFVLHWTTTKKDFRRMGIMGDLLDVAHPNWENSIIMCSAPGKLFSKYKKHYKIFFDPFLLFRKNI